MLTACPACHRPLSAHTKACRYYSRPQHTYSEAEMDETGKPRVDATEEANGACCAMLRKLLDQLERGEATALECTEEIDYDEGEGALTGVRRLQITYRV